MVLQNPLHMSFFTEFCNLLDGTNYMSLSPYLAHLHQGIGPGVQLVDLVTCHSVAIDTP